MIIAIYCCALWQQKHPCLATLITLERPQSIAIACHVNLSVTDDPCFFILLVAKNSDVIKKNAILKDEKD